MVAETPCSDRIDLSRSRRIHVVAVGGAGMSAIATLLAESGHRVSGTDEREGPALAALARSGVEVSVGHRASAVQGADVVVVSTAVPDDNVEVVAARSAGIPVLNRARFLPAMAALQPLLSVAGTHGKTTTTSMLAVALRGAGVDVSWLVGATVDALGSAAGHRTGPYMVTEADESDGSFLAGPRAGAIVTNLEVDHLEFWGDWGSLRAAFEEFVAGTDGPVVLCGDDPEAAALASIAPRGGPAVTYGVSTGCDYVLGGLDTSLHGSEFVLSTPRGRHQRVALSVPGGHNALNAAGALALATELGVDLPAVAAAMGTHTGVHRRFEHRGSARGVQVVDDYAHLPSEVSAALAAGASSGSRRLVVLFQPHRYSRTEALWADFANCFDAADVLVLTDVYPAGEAPREGVSGRLILDAVSAAGGPEPMWAGTLPEAAELLTGLLSDGDLLMTVGAGDVRDVGDMVLAALGGPSS